MPDTPTIVIHTDQGTKTNNVTQLAYKTGNSETTHYRTYRVERGKPFFRRGVQVTVTPQFKGLTIYSPTVTNTPSPGFRNTVTNTAVQWPKNLITP